MILKLDEKELRKWQITQEKQHTKMTWVDRKFFQLAHQYLHKSLTKCYLLWHVQYMPYPYPCLYSYRRINLNVAKRQSVKEEEFHFFFRSEMRMQWKCVKPTQKNKVSDFVIVISGTTCCTFLSTCFCCCFVIQKDATPVLEKHLNSVTSYMYFQR